MELQKIRWPYGEDITVKELALLIKEIIGFKRELFFDTTKPDGTPQKLLDISRINRLGRIAKISLDEGIKKVMGWYKSKLEE